MYQRLVLNPAERLDLVGVSLSAELVVVSVLALAPVSLKDVLITTITWELVRHPATVERERDRGREEGREGKRE